MIKWLLLSFILMTTAPTFALLSPLDQSVTEIQTILSSPDLKKNLQTSETIQDIWKVGKHYIISTENRQLVVEINYAPRNTPGPQQFTLTFYPAKAYGE